MEIKPSELNSREIAQETCDRAGLTNLRLEEGTWIAFSPQKNCDVSVTQVYWNLEVFGGDVDKALWIDGSGNATRQ